MPNDDRDARDARIRRLASGLPALSDTLLRRFEQVIEATSEPPRYTRNVGSDLVDEQFLEGIGDTLRFHHCFSKEPFAKDKFEHAMEWVAGFCGRDAALAPKGNPGHDITIDAIPMSLKTQADRGIKQQLVHISKFMELGKGTWGTEPSDLHGLRDQFLAHLTNYQRIFMLRYLLHKGPDHHYELIEIPRALLLRAAEGTFEMKTASKQFPRPGYCYVSDESGLAFALYFDGGTERKLKVQHLRKSLCVSHAEWRFNRSA